MSNTAVITAPPVRKPSPEVVERALAVGDLAKMDAATRVGYYIATCQSCGLNPLSRPFTAIKNEKTGEVHLYANKDCAEQIRKRDRISIHTVTREFHPDMQIYLVTVVATMPDGRRDEAQGVVGIENLKGAALARAIKIAETQAKRRVTLSLSGLGFPMVEDEDAGGYLDLQTGELTEPRTAAPVLQTVPLTPLKDIREFFKAHIPRPQWEAVSQVLFHCAPIDIPQQGEGDLAKG